MKVFIRTADLDKERPIICASYGDDTVIADDAHGEGMTVLTLPSKTLGGPSRESFGMPSLVAGWRGHAGDMPVKAEAKRRIEQAFPVLDQLGALYDIIDTITKHGLDMSKWPADVRQRKLGYDEGFKYIADVNDKARTHAAAMPRDPASDRIWPKRLTKK
jgi:hypothetical protein